MRASQYVACSMMALALLLSGACSNSLSRPDAGAILAKRFPVVETRTIGTRYKKYAGKYFSWSAQVMPGYPADADFNEIEFLLGQSEVYEKALMAETDTPGSPYAQVLLSPTEDGQKYVTRTRSPGLYDVKICEIVFGEVTGIQLTGPSDAVVEYSLRRTNWSPFGKWYKMKDPSQYPELVPQRAEMQKFDDGWRIKK